VAPDEAGGAGYKYVCHDARFGKFGSRNVEAGQNVGKALAGKR
jgi:hypothetical protein